MPNEIKSNEKTATDAVEEHWYVLAFRPEVDREIAPFQGFKNFLKAELTDDVT